MSKAITTLNIPVDKIDTSARLRPVNPDAAAILAESILEIGLIHPVEVRETEDGWILVAGAHRLAAHKLMNLETIPATVKTLSELDARLREIDENLFTCRLSCFFRAKFLAERKEVYELRYPETKAGVAGGKARQGSANDTLSFANATSEMMGLHQDTVTRLTSLYFDLSDDSQARIAGSIIEDSRKDLELLSKQSRTMQKSIMDRIVAAEGAARTVAEALEAIEGRVEPTESPEQRAYARIIDTYNRAGKAFRRRIVHGIPRDDLDEFLAEKGLKLVEAEG